MAVEISLQILTEMCRGADYPERELDRLLLEREPAVNQLSPGKMYHTSSLNVLCWKGSVLCPRAGYNRLTGKRREDRPS